MKITIKPTWKQHLAWKILEDKKTTDFLFGGGAGGGKSWLGCEWLISNCLRYPDTTYYIARKTLKNLKRTTLRTFYKVARFHGLKREIDFVYQEQQAVITFPKTSSTIDLLEVKYNPSDPEYEDLGSSEYTSGWIEEAGEVSFDAYDTLKSRIGRQNNDKYGIKGKIFITCNPKKNFLYRVFYLPWKKKELPDGYEFLQSLVRDNPRNEKGYIDNLINIKDPVKRQRLLYGNWEYDDDAGVIMKYENIVDIFTNTIDASEEKYLVGDIARFGRDKTVLKLWRGLEVYKIYVFRKQSTEITKNKIKEIAIDEQIPYSHIIIDEDGIGGGIVDSLDGIVGFTANSRAIKIRDDNKNYKNLKTQCAYCLADRINNHKLAVKVKIVTDLEDVTEESYKESLIQELEQIKEINSDNDDKALKIMSKDEVKENIGRSPDYGDCMIMRMMLELTNIRIENEENNSEELEEEKPLYEDIGI